MKKNYFLWILLVLLVSVNTGKAQTYSLKSMTPEQFESGGTAQWSFERHDVNAGTYSTFTMYGDSSSTVNYFDPYCIQRFGSYPIMNRPASGTQFETKRNAWFSDKGEYLYVAAEYPAGTEAGDLVYGSNYPDTLSGYEVYSIAGAGQTPKNSAITFTAPADGYYRADMKVIREDIFNPSLGQMKIYQFFRYGGEDNTYSMGKEFAYGEVGVDLWAAENEALYAEYLALVPETPQISANNGKPVRGLPDHSYSDFMYFYAKQGDKISFEADARSVEHTENTVRGAFARTKWLDLVITVSDKATAETNADKYADPYLTSEELVDSLWNVLDIAEDIINVEGPANGYYTAFLNELEALYLNISQKADDGALRAMEIPSLLDQLWAAITRARTPFLPLPVSGNYYLIKNYTTGTYLGGAGSGDGAVKHEDAQTNPYYHVFLLTGDNDNGYTFQQVASGNYVTHNNQWTGSYAGATDNARQLFRFDNMANPEYYTIQKKKDDGSFANGIGFDTQTSGSTCYFDKGIDKDNTWLFDAEGAKTLLTEQVDVIIAEAQELYNNNSEIDGAASVLSAIATANTTKNNTSATAADIIAAVNSLKSTMQNLLTADKLRLAIADAQATLALHPAIDGASNFQTAINAAQTVYNTSKTAFDAEALNQAITDLAAAKTAFFLKVAEATGTVANPVEITSAIVNPGFDDAANGWTANPAGTATDSEYELYNKTSLDFYQDITGLPNGQYKVTVQGFHRSVGSNTVAAVDAYKAGTEVIPVVLYANDNTSQMLSVYSDSITGTGWKYATETDTMYFANSVGDARIAFDSGKYAENVVYNFISNGTLRLGIKNTATAATNSWTIFDNFRLFYCGTDVSVTPYLEELQAVYDNAKAYYDAILAEEVAGASEGDVFGKYSNDDYTALNTALTAAKAILDANPATLTAEQIGVAKAALLAAKAACVKYTGLNSLASGNYYMLVNDQYYVTNPGNFETATGKDYVISVALGSLLETQNTTGNSQIIKITKQANDRYTFFSALYEEGISNSGPDVNYRNMNENAVFRAEYGGDSELAWRTMNILFDGTNYAIQNAESSSAKGYWGYDASNQKITNGFTEPQYVFKFNSAKTGISTVTKTSDPVVYPVDKSIRIVSDAKANVAVYSLTGTLIANRIVSGTQDIPVQDTGLYIVKVNEKAVKVIVR
ncbi:MAG: hypothetical protein LBM08_13990 [Dysgonamonadaceae bacterium]|jgi:hypothetical protein|nr:hypothetical protein [Dysgonamonadaceae bacterium]